jgi:hypothetical protein
MPVYKIGLLEWGFWANEQKFAKLAGSHQLIYKGFNQVRQTGFHNLVTRLKSPNDWQTEVFHCVSNCIVNGLVFQDVFNFRQ